MKLDSSIDRTPTPDALLEFIKPGGISFVELENRFDMKGNMEWGFEDKNIWFWFGMSEGAIAALKGLLDAGRIQMKRTTILVYMCDGAVPRMPIAKQIRKYKSEHWLPIVFNPTAEAK